MSSPLAPAEVARIVGAAILVKDESQVNIHYGFNSSIASVEGFTPDKIRASIYVLTEGEMTEVRAAFTSHPGFAFGFKVFTDEATEERVRRYAQYYLARHNEHIEMMK